MYVFRVGVAIFDDRNIYNVLSIYSLSHTNEVRQTSFQSRCMFEAE